MDVRALLPSGSEWCNQKWSRGWDLFWCGPCDIVYIHGSPDRNWILFLFWPHHLVWNLTVLSLHKGQDSYSFHRCIWLRLQSVYELNATACQTWWYPQNTGQNNVWFLSETFDIFPKLGKRARHLSLFVQEWNPDSLLVSKISKLRICWWQFGWHNFHITITCKYLSYLDCWRINEIVECIFESNHMISLARDVGS